MVMVWRSRTQENPWTQDRRARAFRSAIVRSMYRNHRQHDGVVSGPPCLSRKVMTLFLAFRWRDAMSDCHAIISGGACSELAIVAAIVPLRQRQTVQMCTAIGRRSVHTVQVRMAVK